MMRLLLALAALSPAHPPDTTYLYRVLLLRAAPGRLLDVTDLYRQREPTYRVAGDQPPVILRHRQGDHWDLMLIFPMGDFPTYYASDRVARREGQDAFAAAVAPLVSWREETFFHGPDPTVLLDVVAGGNLVHIEMFVARPERRADLVAEREMENAYLAALNLPRNLLFTRVAGGAWDLFTLGVYRDMVHFAAGDTIPPDRADEAARAAGFTAANRIGTYLRTLIQRHNDTLARPIR